MNCAICDKDDEVVSIFPNDLCSQCQAIIEETLEELELDDEDLYDES
jgi:hypothetical protein